MARRIGESLHEVEVSWIRESEVDLAKRKRRSVNVPRSKRRMILRSAMV